MTLPPDVIDAMQHAYNAAEQAHLEGTGDGADPMRAALSALADSGWVVAPKEPTKEMIVAAENAMEDFEDETIGSNADGDRYSYTYRIYGWERGIYQAMLAAALPEPPHDCVAEVG